MKKILTLKKDLIDSFVKENIKLKEDKLIYVLHLIIMNTLNKRNEFISKTDGRVYINLNSKLLKQKLGNNYKEYFDFWIKRRVIEENPKYSSGNFSKSYSLATKYLDNYELHDVKDFTFRRSLRFKKGCPNGLAFLKKGIDKLDLNIERAKVIVNRLKPSDDISMSDAKMLKNSRKYIKCQLAINWFESQDRAFIIDDSGYRLHTVLTMSNKILRECITIDGKKLLEIDMSSSQFYCLIYLMDINNWNEIINKNNRILNDYKGYNIKYYTSNTNMCTIIDEIQASGEFIKYKDLVTGDQFYEHFLKLYQKVYPNATRKRIKQLMIKALFSKNETHCAGVKGLFKSEFPNIYALISFIKRSRDTKETDRHAVMAILLQRIESELILNRVCKRIHKEKPSFPILTIHDCLVTTVGNEDYFTKVLKEEANNFIKAIPHTKTKLWIPEHIESCIYIEMANKKIA